MSVLKEITDDLDAARKKVESAGDKAAAAKDKKGAAACREEADRIRELKKNFSQQGGDETSENN